MKIPFCLFPFAWGMRGKARERAKAEYQLQGYDLAKKLAQIDLEGVELERKLLEIDYKYDKIAEEPYEAQYIELMESGVEKQLAAVNSLLKFGHISDTEARKRTHTIQNKPFFEFNVELVDGDLELDVEYNDAFIAHIKQFGYEDSTDSSAIDAYVSDCGRRISQTDDEALLDANDALANSIIKSERDGANTFYT